MNSEPGQQNDGHHCCDTNLNLAAAKLDVYRHERLAYTEPPQKQSAPRPIAKRASAVLSAMCHWALAHL